MHDDFVLAVVAESANTFSKPGAETFLGLGNAGAFLFFPSGAPGVAPGQIVSRTKPASVVGQSLVRPRISVFAFTSSAAGRCAVPGTAVRLSPADGDARTSSGCAHYRPA